MKRRPGLLLVLAVLAFVAGSTPQSVAATRHLAVTGFQEGSDRLTAIDRSAAALSTVGVDGINLTRTGAWTTAPDRSALGQRTRAHHDGLRAELLVGNFAGSDFDERIAHRLFADPDHISRVAQHLANLTRQQHWDGVCVDLESLTARDRPGLSSFLHALRTALGHVPGTHRSLSIAVQAATSLRGYRAYGYDLAAVGRLVDRVVLMAYDQHGPWENTPGPVGALRWQRAALHVLLSRVPAGRVDLGVAGYGYAWRPHANVQLGDAAARRLAGAHARWNSVAGEWTAHLADGSTLWWADARSYRLRAALARRAGLHGLAVWSLGLSDPIRRS